ncbi:AAA family ATPase [Pseudooceanicola aestuarii]|uniref:AAA family ATPase n=1 Tax=Pseudooceanicola aestuarii TaxID=2697319 RepID=UPI0013D0BCD3|nr:hypothetical protein [Pseudooceanicola aestuarii]
MLTDPALRVCTLADGVETTLLLAEALALLPPHRREDIGIGDDQPTGADLPEYDLALAALAPTDAQMRPEAEDTLTRLAARARLLVLLADPVTAGALSLPPGCKVLPPQALAGLPALVMAAQAPADAPATGGDRADPDRTRRRAAPIRALVSRLKPGRAPAPAAAPQGARLADVLARPDSLIAVQGLSGGVGATTLAVNLAVQLAEARPHETTCLIDANPQFGTVAAYLDLAENHRVTDAYLNPGALDDECFEQCLTPCGPNLIVLPAPDQILPPDALSGPEMRHLLRLARTAATHVIVDMPHTVTDWTGEVFSTAEAVLAVATLQISAARNARALRQLLAESGVTGPPVHYILNRAPRERDTDWQDRREVFETGLGTTLSLVLSDGGAEVARCGDLGAPVTRQAPRNPLSRDLRQLIDAARRSTAQPAHV